MTGSKAERKGLTEALAYLRPALRMTNQFIFLCRMGLLPFRT
jgi:hypothetical protein